MNKLEVKYSNSQIKKISDDTLSTPINKLVNNNTLSTPINKLVNNNVNKSYLFITIFIFIIISIFLIFNNNDL